MAASLEGQDLLRVIGRFHNLTMARRIFTRLPGLGLQLLRTRTFPQEYLICRVI